MCMHDSIVYVFFLYITWARSLVRAHSFVVTNLRSETKDSGSRPAANYVQRRAFCSNGPTNDLLIGL